MSVKCQKTQTLFGQNVYFDFFAKNIEQIFAFSLCL